MWAPIGIGTHSSIVSRTMTMCIYVLSPKPIPIADARHYYPLIINASQAIRVPTSLDWQLLEFLRCFEPSLGACNVESKNNGTKLHGKF